MTSDQESPCFSPASAQALADLLPGGIFRSDTEGNFTYVDARWCALTGMEPASALGTGWAAALHPDDREAFLDSWRRAVKGGHRFEMQCRLVHPDTTTKRVDCRAAPERGELGSITGYIGLMLEGEDRRRADEELRLANFAVENASAGIFLGVANGRFTRVNRIAREMCGYSEEELLHMCVANLDTEVSAPHTADHVSQLRQQKSQTFESRHRHKDGHTYPVEVTTGFLEFEGGEYVIAHVRDITERRQAEEMRNTQASVLEASRDFIAIATLDEEITYLNKGARALVGLDTCDCDQRLTLRDFFWPEDLPDLASRIMPVLRRDGWVKSESRLRHFGTGRPVPVEIEGIVVRNARGVPICLATVTRDLTERRAAESQRAKLETQLAQAQKMEALGRLTGGIAHDFNNSLTVILGYAAMLASSANLSARERNAVAAITESGARSREMVRQLMGFSRQQVIAPATLNLNRILTNSLDLLGRLVGEDIELLAIHGEGLWDVKLDATQVDQVFMNLAANARDAMSNGGKLTLRTANVTLDETCTRAGEYVLLAVSDTGEGMDAETAAQVFEPFFTTKEQGKGTGLGLATVYGIVRQNDGFIEVYSQPGRGTTFKVYFPRLASACAAVSETGDAGRAAGTGARILLVEDDELVREMIADALGTLGYEALTAADASGAIGLCADLSNRIDLVITDVVMPGMQGTELRDRVVEFRPELKVLFVSGYTSNVIVRRGILKPGVHFLQKPFSFESLGTKIREILNEPAA